MEKKNDGVALFVVDRKEIESVRSVLNLIRGSIKRASEHHHSAALSVAVFGQPGAGKSFFVKRVAESANIDIPNEYLSINLANQYEPAAVLNNIITFTRNYININNDIHTANTPAKVPVIFIDEFDTSYGGSRWGWLKYILPIMESWPNEPRDVRISPILVFAGGTSINYHDFCRENNWTSADDRGAFISAKGPDFVSKHGGHIDILGPNPVDEYDDGYVIRRSLILRSLLLKHIAITETQGVNLADYIDEAIPYAMLKVRRFKHGSRSMRAISEMCVPFGSIDKMKYIPASLPTVTQLSMHVDSSESQEHLSEHHRSKNTKRAKLQSPKIPPNSTSHALK